MSIHNKPSVRQIQPMGFSGCLEAIRAPTIGKARKGTKISRALKIPPVPQVLGTCADRAATYSATLAKNMAPERPASDQASQEEARVFALPTSRSRRCVPSATTPLYRTLVSQALRQTLRRSFSTRVQRTKIHLSREQAMYACILEDGRG